MTNHPGLPRTERVLGRSQAAGKRGSPWVKGSCPRPWGWWVDVWVLSGALKLDLSTPAGPASHLEVHWCSRPDAGPWISLRCRAHLAWLIMRLPKGLTSVISQTISSALICLGSLAPRTALISPCYLHFLTESSPEISLASLNPPKSLNTSQIVVKSFPISCYQDTSQISVSFIPQQAFSWCKE